MLAIAGVHRVERMEGQVLFTFTTTSLFVRNKQTNKREWQMHARVFFRALLCLDVHRPRILGEGWVRRKVAVRLAEPCLVRVWGVASDWRRWVLAVRSHVRCADGASNAATRKRVIQDRERRRWLVGQRCVVTVGTL